MTDALAVPLERHFPDGRRAEVVGVSGGVLVRVYVEKLFDSIAEATVALTLWDGLGELQFQTVAEAKRAKPNA